MASSGDAHVAHHAARIRASIEAHPRAARRARLEIACGDALWFCGDLAAAGRCYRAALARARRDRDVTIEAFARIRRATLGPERDRLEDAHRELERATALAATSREPLLVALAAGIRGFLLRAGGDVAGALAAFEEQAERARLARDAFYFATAEASAADCHLVLGEHALGRMRFERAFRAMKRIDPAWARTLEGYMGMAAWEVGAAAEAAARCHRAMRDDLGPRFRVLFAAARAGALAELGEHAAAATALATAEQAAENAAYGAEDALEAATLLVAFARAFDPASRRAVARRIETHLEKRGRSTSEDRRAFVRALERVTTTGSAHRVSALPPGVLEQRPRLARVVQVLEAYAERGELASPLELFRAVWPEEREADRATAEVRVRKAISLLRGLGLRGAIVTGDRGYALRRDASRASRQETGDG